MGLLGEVTEDGSHLVITVWRGTDPETQLFVQDLRVPDAPVVEVLSGFDAAYEYLANEGARFWVKTDKEAPRSRIVAFDLEDGAPGEWVTVAPERDEPLQG